MTREGTAMQTIASSSGNLDPATADFYRDAIRALGEEGVPFLVGGAYAFARYTGIDRHTKDFDVFVRPADALAALAALRARLSCQTEMTFPHWLGKAYCGDDFVDVIFSSGNGVAEVDDQWFAHAVTDEVLGLPAKLIPPEEMIWSKSFVMERERYDGADVAHMLRARAATLDWPHLLRRFGRDWRVLLCHLILFGYIYPGERGRVPGWVMNDLVRRLQTEQTARAAGPRLCRGTLISREQYLIDIDGWGLADARLTRGAMTPAETEQWTAAIGSEDRDHPDTCNGEPEQ